MAELSEALAAVLTWAITGLLRLGWPKLWEKLDTEKVRLAVVALVAVVLAVVGGVAQGLGWWQIVQLAITALSGSVLIRRLTKTDRTKRKPGDVLAAQEHLRSDRGIRTKTPAPMTEP